MPNQPDFEISARPIGADESQHEGTRIPDWSEIQLDIDCEMPWRPPLAHGTMYITRAAGHLIIEQLRDALTPGLLGRSIKEMLWAELDSVMDDLMGMDLDPDANHLKGQALGLATSIAILVNPYGYDIDQIREEALLRWEARQPG